MFPAKVLGGTPGCDMASRWWWSGTPGSPSQKSGSRTSPLIYSNPVCGSLPDCRQHIQNSC